MLTPFKFLLPIFSMLNIGLRAKDQVIFGTLRCVCAVIVSACAWTSVSAQAVDTTPPVLTGFTFEILSASQTYGVGPVVKYSIAFTDDLSGIFAAGVEINQPSGLPLQQYTLFNGGSLNGTTLNGTLSNSFALPPNSPQGSYVLVKICLTDYSQNQRCNTGLALTTFGSSTTAVVSSGPDTAAPAITGFTFSPATQNISSAPGNLNATVQFTDNTSGVAKIDYSLTKPDGSVSQQNSTNVTAGTPQNGSMQFSWPLPVSSPAGTYTLSKLCATDVAGNNKCYESAAMLALNPANSVLVSATRSIPFSQSATSSAIVTNEEKDPPAPVFNVTKTASGNPFIGGKPGQFYTINIAVQNGRVSAPILLLDKLPSGISTSGPITAVGASISNCPATGATDLAGCTITLRGNSTNVVVTVPISVAAAAVSGANTATVKGGGSALCTGIAPACSGSTGAIAIVQPVDAVDDAVSQLAGANHTFNVAANDKYPVGSQFAGGNGSTCLNVSVSTAGIASYALPASTGAVATCVIPYQVCAPAASQAGCDSANLRVTAIPLTAVFDTTTVAANTAGTFNVAANDSSPSGAQFSIDTSGSSTGTSCANAQVTPTGMASFTSLAGGAGSVNCVVKYKLCGPAPHQTVCSANVLSVFNPAATGCSRVNLTYNAAVPASSPTVSFSSIGNGCTFTASTSALPAGSYKFLGTVLPIGTSVYQPMSMVTFTLATAGLLKGKAEYDTATSKWKLVQVP